MKGVTLMKLVKDAAVIALALVIFELVIRAFPPANRLYSLFEDGLLLGDGIILAAYILLFIIVLIVLIVVKKRKKQDSIHVARNK